jgi:hypothetical protein
VLLHVPKTRKTVNTEQGREEKGERQWGESAIVARTSMDMRSSFCRNRTRHNDAPYDTEIKAWKTPITKTRTTRVALTYISPERYLPASTESWAVLTQRTCWSVYPAAGCGRKWGNGSCPTSRSPCRTATQRGHLNIELHVSKHICTALFNKKCQKPTLKLHNLCSSPSIIRMIKSMRMSWAGHIARVERTGMHIEYLWESQKERDH